MDAGINQPQKLSYDELLTQNEKLRRDLERMSVREKFAWLTLVETSRKLQASSASIKAAVSSLLNYDIFWDGANQHEFLVTINASIDQVSDLVKLLALELRVEAGALELRKEPHFLQEILSGVYMNSLRRFPRLELTLTLPEEGKLVEVDYSYLTLALDLLLSVLEPRTKTLNLHIEAIEDQEFWMVKFTGLELSVITQIVDMFAYRVKPSMINSPTSENLLKLHVACEVLQLQNIQAIVQEEKPETIGFRIPAVTGKPGVQG